MKKEFFRLMDAYAKQDDVLLMVYDNPERYEFIVRKIKPAYENVQDVENVALARNIDHIIVAGQTYDVVSREMWWLSKGK